jgi:hypothetical protein
MVAVFHVRLGTVSFGIIWTSFMTFVALTAALAGSLTIHNSQRH